METTKTFYQNRYYNDVFGLIYESSIPTSQTKDKQKRMAFVSHLKDQVGNIKINRPQWPYKQKVTIALLVTGPLKYIQRIDLDNAQKLLFDCLKGSVIKDDKQIFSVMAEKQILEYNGFLVGIRTLADNEINYCIPPLYGEEERSSFGGAGELVQWESSPIRY
jgi:Holliday junction resolvase RusA-like endonuclease